MTNGGNIQNTNAFYHSGAYSDTFAEFEKLINQMVGPWIHENTSLYHTKLSGQHIHTVNGSVIASASDIVVTPTTIKSRLKYSPEIVESLLHQTLAPVRIELNISRESYLLDEGI